MNKKIKTEKKLLLNRTTLRVVGGGGIPWDAMEGIDPGGGGGSGSGSGINTTIICTMTCGCPTQYTAAQQCAFTC